MVSKPGAGGPQSGQFSVLPGILLPPRRVASHIKVSTWQDRTPGWIWLSRTGSGQISPYCCVPDFHSRYSNKDFFIIRFPGKMLKGKKYKPLFQYFAKVCGLCSCLFPFGPHTKLQYQNLNGLSNAFIHTYVQWFRMIQNKNQQLVLIFNILSQKSYLTYSPYQTFPLRERLINCLQHNHRKPHISYYVDHYIVNVLSGVLFVLLYFYLTVFVSIQCGDKGAFQVVTDNYVKEEEGTGVVHQAPYFGAVSELSRTFSYVGPSY